MQAIKDPIVDPGPPGSTAGWSFCGVPWWLIGIIATIAVIVLQIATNQTWREGFDFIRSGLMLTLLGTLGGFVIAVVFGLFVGLARLSNNTVIKNLAMYYIELIRGVPVLLTVLVISIVVFGQGSNAIGFEAPGKAIHGTLALGIIYAAFIAEAFRAGIESAPNGQREAGDSMGLAERPITRKITLPKAIRNIMPALGNDLIALLRDSSLVSVIAVRELAQTTKLWTGSSFRFMEGYMILTAFYLKPTASVSLHLRWYERRIAAPGH